MWWGMIALPVAWGSCVHLRSSPAALGHRLHAEGRPGAAHDRVLPPPHLPGRPPPAAAGFGRCHGNRGLAAEPGPCKVLGGIPRE